MLAILPNLTRRYPKLDEQIRRYLAGEDFTDEDEAAEETATDWQR